MSSSRLPGKVMMEVGGKPLIHHLIDGIKAYSKEAVIIVATSHEREDDELADYVSGCGINIFRGDLHNVSQRFLQCAEHYCLDYAVRTNADNFLFPFELFDSISRSIHRNEGIDFYSNVLFRTFPSGYSIECIRVSLLRREINNFSDFDKEHVLTYFYSAKHIKYKYYFSQFNKEKKLSIDTLDDFERLKRNNDLYGIIDFKFPVEKIIDLW